MTDIKTLAVLDANARELDRRLFELVATFDSEVQKLQAELAAAVLEASRAAEGRIGGLICAGRPNVAQANAYVGLVLAVRTAKERQARAEVEAA